MNGDWKPKGIKWYYADEWVAIANMDCREGMKEIPDGSIDLVLTDPPYGINHCGGNLAEWHKKMGDPLFKNDEVMANDDGSLDLSFLYEYPKWIIWGFPFIKSIADTGWLVWVKQDLDPNLPIIGTPVEMASTNTWQGFKLIKAIWAGYLRDNAEIRYDHPTQKSQKVIDFCINKSSKANDTILDPFLGSGTTAYCAKKLNRHCIGFEISEKYCEIAAKRCSQSVMDFGGTPVLKEQPVQLGMVSEK